MGVVPQIRIIINLLIGWLGPTPSTLAVTFLLGDLTAKMSVPFGIGSGAWVGGGKN